MRIVIWGKGAYGKDLLAYIKELNITLKSLSLPLFEIICVFDNLIDKDVRYIDGIAVKKPSIEVMLDADIAIIAVKKYEDILVQLQVMGVLLKNICIYSPRYRLRFLCSMRKLMPKNEFEIFFSAYNERLDKIDYIMDNAGEMDASKWKKLLDEWGNEEFMAALEEAGNNKLSQYMYNNLFNGFLKKEKNKTVGIYYYRFYNGGIERVIAQLIPVFLKLGYRVVLITEEIVPEREYECPPDVIRVLLPSKKINKFERYHVLGEIIKQYNIDIMHLNGCYDYEVNSMVVPYLCSCGIRTVLHIHNFYKNISNLDALKYAYRLADRVVVLSRADETFWLEQGVKAKYIPNPINIDISYVYHKMERVAPTIVWIGRIDAGQKQIYETVNIMKELVKIIPTVKLKIIGKPDNYQILEELKKRIDEASLQDHFIFCGYSNNPWQLCRDADVFLLTSAYEGFSMVLIECKMAGLPAVVYSLPYLELLRDGKGYLEVPQKDAAGAARELSKILLDKHLQEKLSREARESIESFSRIDIAEMWQEVLAGSSKN